ncbi:MAG: hypothetical protein PHU71_01915 [Candidatus Gracilibacteria bacterium]|nr:hypothetical protein [Candidatus Gracilibacteria bacterium]
MTIKIPFSQQIYDSASDKVHSIRIVENNSGSREDRRRFRYLLQIGYQDQVTVKLEILPENEETLKRLIDYGIRSSAAKAEGY